MSIVTVKNRLSLQRSVNELDDKPEIVRGGGGQGEGRWENKKNCLVSCRVRKFSLVNALYVIILPSTYV